MDLAKCCQGLQKNKTQASFLITAGEITGGSTLSMGLQTDEPLGN